MNQGFFLDFDVPTEVSIKITQIDGFELRVELLEITPLNKVIYFRKHVSKVQSGSLLVELRLGTSRSIIQGFAVVEKLLEVVLRVRVFEL
jgi:hypothetical protein